MRRWIKAVAAVAVLALVVVVLRLSVFAPEPVAVEVAPASSGRVEETVTNSRAGTVVARRRAKLSPELGGLVVSIPFREGQQVKKGDILLRLDDRLQQAECSLAERELEAVLAQRDQACLAAERAARERKHISRLAEQEIASTDLEDKAKNEAERSAAACEAGRANAERARAASELARRKLDNTILRAPFDGVVAEVTTEVGEWVTPSPPAMPVPPVIDILDPSSVYISAPMDEVDSARIGPGQPVRINVDSHPGQGFPGRVQRVAPYVLDVEAQNRTVEIDVELDDPDFGGRLLPGTSADVEVILEEREAVLRVPTAALLQGNQVLVVDEGRLVAREVRTGLQNWDYTEVVEGLSAGEEVVVSLDRPEVQPGARVVAKRGDSTR